MIGRGGRRHRAVRRPAAFPRAEPSAAAGTRARGAAIADGWTARKRRSDPGNPEVCPVFDFHKIYSPPETIALVDRECRTAGIGCIDCKKMMSTNLLQEMGPILEKRRRFPI